jgi:naphthoate synthase
MISELFDPAAWTRVEGFDFTEITYHRAVDQGTVRVAFNRPEVRNAFRPHTVDELCAALDHARQTADVGCVLLTGNGPSPKDGGWAFCSGGDQRIRGADGYRYEGGGQDSPRVGRLHILEAQRLIRFMPKVVICVVPGWAAGGGHSLHVVSDLTLASAEHAGFKRLTPTRGPTAASALRTWLARSGGSSRERSFLRPHLTHRGGGGGCINAVVPHADPDRSRAGRKESIARARICLLKRVQPR